VRVVKGSMIQVFSNMIQNIKVIILFITIFVIFGFLRISAQPIAPENTSTYQTNEQEVKDENKHWNKMVECSRANEAQVEDAKCIKCHTNVLDKETYAKETPPIVRIHYFHYNESGRDFTCVTCHKKMDPFNDSGSMLRKQVNPFICYTCHEPFNQK